MRKYAAASTVTLELAEGEAVTLPHGPDAVELARAELYQATEASPKPIDVVEQLEPTFSAAVSLAELYGDAGQHDAVVELTNGLAIDSDAHAFLLALRENGMFDAAREAIKRRCAAAAWTLTSGGGPTWSGSNTYLLQGRRSQARKDLERILAEDGDYP